MSSRGPDRILATIASRYPVVLSAALRAIDPVTLVEPGNPHLPIPPVPAEPMLVMDVGVPTSEPSYRARAQWEASILAGVVDEMLGAAGHPRLGGVDITFVTPEGVRDHMGGGLGRVAPGKQFVTVTTELLDEVRDRATAAGLSDVRVGMLAGIQDAIVVEATAASPAALAALRERPGGLFFMLPEPPGKYEGVFAIFEDPSGRPLLITATVSRIGCGMAWSDGSPGLEVGHGRISVHRPDA